MKSQSHPAPPLLDLGDPISDSEARANVQKLTLSDLERLLLKAADILRRTGMAGSEYKQYLFGVLFLKRLTDHFEQEQRRLRASRTRSDSDLGRNGPDQRTPGFRVPSLARWVTKVLPARGRESLIKMQLGPLLNKALSALEDENPSVLQGVLKPIDFAATRNNRRLISDEVIAELLELFSTVSFTNDSFKNPDVLGDGYEYLVKHFAESAGKKGGEFYTPHSIARLLVELVEPAQGMSVGDPTCGSGGLLVQAARYIEAQGGEPTSARFYGQEVNPTSWAICKMNMILHGLSSAEILNDDILKQPRHVDKGGSLLLMDRQVANPPFAMNYSGREMAFKDRFHTLMPERAKRAELMFVQHVLATLAPHGKAAIMVPHGVLSRSGKELEGRKQIVLARQLEAVIGLPAGLFYSTEIPACILVLNKKNASERDHVFFIDAERGGQAERRTKALAPEEIEKILHVYRYKLTVPGFSARAPIALLQAQKFNLNVRSYVDRLEPPEPQEFLSHVHGGIPEGEIDRLDEWWESYPGLKQQIFSEGVPGVGYWSMALNLPHGDPDVRGFVEQHHSVLNAHARFREEVAACWAANETVFESLPGSTTFRISHELAAAFERCLVPLKQLDRYQVRGVFSEFTELMASDFKIVNRMGWSPDMIIPEEIIALRTAHAAVPDADATRERDKRVDDAEAKPYKSVPVDSGPRSIEQSLSFQHGLQGRVPGVLRNRINPAQVKVVVLNRWKRALVQMYERRLCVRRDEFVRRLRDIQSRYGTGAHEIDKSRQSCLELLAHMERLRAQVHIGRNWPEVPLKECADIRIGGTPSTSVPGYWGGSVRWMASGDIHMKRIRDVSGRITELGLRNSDARIIPKGAVAIALAGQGRTRGCVAFTEVALSSNQSVALVTARAEVLDAEYLYQSLIPRYEELRAMSSGGGRGTITKTMLANLPIRLPPLSEQREIASMLRAVDSEIETAERALQKLKATKAGLALDLLASAA